MKFVESDLPFEESLKYHFGATTDTWSSSVKLSAFETLKSEGVSLISNLELRNELVLLYDELVVRQKELFKRYRDLIDEGSSKVLSSRFDQLWAGIMKIG